MKHLQKLIIAILITIFTVMHVNAQVNISIRIGPPALPSYTQPYCPGEGYIWVPGYWAYTESGYYWVPGSWVFPPETGYYWTPGYWEYTGNYYTWNPGYWGRTVGYYGGINYGYGYGGRGYYGGEWSGNTFRYNTAITRVNTTVVHNTYVNKTVVNNNIIVNSKRSSFNGRGGVTIKPSSQELAAGKENHLMQTSAQVSHQDGAKADKRQFATANNGRPARLTEGQATNNNHAATPKSTSIRNVKANHTIANKKVSHTSNIALKNQQTTVHNQNKVRVNQEALKQQQVNAANQRKEPAAQKQPVQRTTTVKRKAAQNQNQQQVQPMKKPSPATRTEDAPRRDDNKDKH